MMKPGNVIVVHFGEIWLKGRNRSYFVGILLENIRGALKGTGCVVQKMRDRFIVKIEKKADKEKAMDLLSTVFGISWYAPVTTVGNDMEEIVKTAVSMMDKKKTYRVAASRTYKQLQYNSMDITREVIKEAIAKGYNVDKDAADTIYINVMKGETMLYSDKRQGAYGLPVGCSGKAIVLLSGGIDSPVAAVYAMKRGLLPIYLHIHAFPKNSTAETSKMRNILQALSRYSGQSKCYYAPAHMFQAAVLGKADRLELVLFKRFAYKLAEEVAKSEKAKVIVTGESLGQVASQTASNLIATEHLSEFFMMRPLIGFDKQEIVNEAKRLGTYELSIKEYPDVCSINAKNPLTSARRNIVDRLYEECGLDEALERTIEKSTAVTISKR
jgi:thiamine biosynthesis protein ThiI